MRILYMTRYDGTDTRCTKVTNTLVKHGHQVTFVGWDRTPDRPKQLNLSPKCDLRIYKRSASIGESSWHGWIGYYLHYIRVLREVRPDVVQAINEEKAVMALPFKHLYFKRLILEVYDSVIGDTRDKWWYMFAARVVRAIANTFSDRIVETGEELRNMLGRHAGKATIIMNCPLDPGEQCAMRLPEEGPVRLAVGGSLARWRDGLETILRATEMFPPGAVQVMASGWLHDHYAKEVFAKHPSVSYKWLRSQREFLDQAASCDALLYLCNDAVRNEYRAWVVPNRLFDSMAVARPLIIGRKARISSWVEGNGLGYACDAESPDELAAIIHKLKDHRKELPAYVARVRSLFAQSYTWEIMEARWAAMYQELGQDRQSGNHVTGFRNSDRTM